MKNYQGKQITIVGLGLTGLSCINFFLSRGIIPRVIDTRIRPLGFCKLKEKINYHFGGMNDEWLLSSDLIVVSPGVALFHPSLISAKNAGIKIVRDIDIFNNEVKAPVVAITGSNGKSTVTALVGEMAKAAGFNVGIGGNIGLPVLMTLDTSCELYVLEVSSFQMEGTGNLQSVAATILNIYEDHMDRYPFGLEQYRATKLRIYENTEICIVNANDTLTLPIYNMNKCCISFGINVGDYHLFFYQGETWLCIQNEKILNVKEMKLYGKHNYTNALAALALSDAIGLPRDSSLKVLKAFNGLPYRFQIILERNGIRWINDSKATNISSTKAALDSLDIGSGRLHLLLGGDGKSTDFSSLKSHLIDNNNIYLYCFGRDSNNLAALYPEVSEKTKTMEEAIYILASRLKPNDVVLLSPACSSLDQFKNFEQRGEIFTRLANELG